MSPARKVSLDQKMLQGTNRPSREINRLSVSGGLPKPPKYLTKEQRKEWKRITKFLEQQGQELYTELDASALTSFVISWASYLNAESILREQGEIIQVPLVNKASGNVVGHTLKPSPWLSVSRTRLVAANAAMDRLGLSVKAREGLTMPLPKRKAKVKKWEQAAFNPESHPLATAPMQSVHSDDTFMGIKL